MSIRGLVRRVRQLRRRFEESADNGPPLVELHLPDNGEPSMPVGRYRSGNVVVVIYEPPADAVPQDCAERCEKVGAELGPED